MNVILVTAGAFLGLALIVVIFMLRVGHGAVHKVQSNFSSNVDRINLSSKFSFEVAQIESKYTQIHDALIGLMGTNRIVRVFAKPSMEKMLKPISNSISSYCSKGGINVVDEQVLGKWMADAGLVILFSPVKTKINALSLLALVLIFIDIGAITTLLYMQ